MAPINCQDGHLQIVRQISYATAGNLRVGSTGDEDEPVLSQGDLEEENTLDRSEVVDDTSVWNEERATEDPGTESKQDTKDNGDDPNLWQLPLDWALLVVGIVVSDSDGSQISEKSQENDQVDSDGLLDDDHGGNQVDLEMQAESDSVLNVCLHSLENLSGDLDGGNNGGETWSEENDIGGSLSGFSGTLDGNTTVRLLQRWSVVDTVTSHGSKMSTLLEHLDDLVLVLRENLSETISLLNEIVLSSSGKTTVNELVRVVNLGTESQHLAGLLGDSDSVTSQHLDGKTKNLSFSDSRGGILTRRVEHRQHSKQLPWLVTLLDSDTQRSETTSGELGSLVLVEIGLLLGTLTKVENGLWSSLGAGESDTVLDTDSSDTLGNRVERSELLGLPAFLKDSAGSWVTLESENGNLVDWVERLDIVGRSESCNSHHPVDIDALSDKWLANGKLVGSERTSLVRAKNVDTGKRLNGGKLLYDGLLLGKVSSSDSESGGGNDWKTDWHTNDEENKSPVEKLVLGGIWGSELNVSKETTNPGDKNPAHNEDQKRRSDGVHDGLEVTLVLSTSHERSSATNEGHLGGVGDESVSLSTLATSGVVQWISDELVNSEGLSSHGRLIDGEDGVSTSVVLSLLVLVVGSLLFTVALVLELTNVSLVTFLVVVVANKTGISWDNGTILNDDDVSWNQFTGLDLVLAAITNDERLHGNITLERSNDIGGLFLYRFVRHNTAAWKDKYIP